MTEHKIVRSNSNSQEKLEVVPSETEKDDTNQVISQEQLKIDVEAQNQPQQNVNEAHEQPQPINTQALNGLRGIVSVHIMIFHSLIFSKWRIFTMGSSQMPLFFLISGFILALNEGKTQYASKHCNCCTSNQTLQSQLSLPVMNQKNFYQRRAARILPLYYLLNILSIPLVFGGYGDYPPNIYFIIACILTVFVASTWFIIPIVINGVSWFVSTLWFFYSFFPCILPKLQKYTQEKMSELLTKCLWVQFIIAVILYFSTIFVLGPGLAFYISTFWPVSRFPVFVAGVLGGLLRLQNYNYAETHEFSKKCDKFAVGYIITFVVASMMQTLTRGLTTFHFWVQIAIPKWQLEFIYLLTQCDINTTRTYKILTSKTALFLGRISYSLYLVHLPIQYYICWIVYGTISRPTCEIEQDDQDCNQQWEMYNDKKLLPPYCIPIAWIVSFLLAVGINRFFEEPMRKYLRPT